MNRFWILFPAVFLIGGFAGYLMFELRQDQTVQASKSVEQTVDHTTGELPATLTIVHSDEVVALKARIAELESRIEHIESNQVLNEVPEPQPEVFDGTLAAVAPDAFNGTANGSTQAPIVEGLVRAGVDSWTAEDIARKQSESSLARLELRDKAVREGYMGTNQYREELRELMNQEVSIREEVGEDYFDRYLFHTGQTNRVAIESVMMGSAAEDVGLQSGDLLVRYEDQRLFNWNDLRSMTTLGDRNELVELTIVRSGTEMTMTIPRGPMGVRLNSVRVDPDDG